MSLATLIIGFREMKIMNKANLEPVWKGLHLFTSIRSGGRTPPLENRDDVPPPPPGWKSVGISPFENKKIK